MHEWYDDAKTTAERVGPTVNHLEKIREKLSPLKRGAFLSYAETEDLLFPHEFKHFRANTPFHMPLEMIGIGGKLELVVETHCVSTDSKGKQDQTYRREMHLDILTDRKQTTVIGLGGSSFAGCTHNLVPLPGKTGVGSSNMVALSSTVNGWDTKANTPLRAGMLAGAKARANDLRGLALKAKMLMYQMQHLHALPEEDRHIAWDDNVDPMSIHSMAKTTARESLTDFEFIVDVAGWSADQIELLAVLVSPWPCQSIVQIYEREDGSTVQYKDLASALSMDKVRGLIFSSANPEDHREVIIRLEGFIREPHKLMNAYMILFRTLGGLDSLFEVWHGTTGLIPLIHASIPKDCDEEIVLTAPYPIPRTSQTVLIEGEEGPTDIAIASEVVASTNIWIGEHVFAHAALNNLHALAESLGFFNKRLYGGLFMDNPIAIEIMQLYRAGTSDIRHPFCRIVAPWLIPMADFGVLLAGWFINYVSSVRGEIEGDPRKFLVLNSCLPSTVAGGSWETLRKPMTFKPPIQSGGERKPEDLADCLETTNWWKMVVMAGGHVFGGLSYAGIKDLPAGYETMVQYAREWRGTYELTEVTVNCDYPTRPVKRYSVYDSKLMYRTRLTEDAVYEEGRGGRPPIIIKDGDEKATNLSSIDAPPTGKDGLLRMGQAAFSKEQEARDRADAAASAHKYKEEEHVLPPAWRDRIPPVVTEAEAKEEKDKVAVPAFDATTASGKYLLMDHLRPIPNNMRQHNACGFYAIAQAIRDRGYDIHPEDVARELGVTLYESIRLDDDLIGAFCNRLGFDMQVLNEVDNVVFRYLNDIWNPRVDEMLCFRYTQNHWEACVYTAQACRPELADREYRVIDRQAISKEEAARICKEAVHDGKVTRVLTLAEALANVVYYAPAEQPPKPKDKTAKNAGQKDGNGAKK